MGNTKLRGWTLRALAAALLAVALAAGVAVLSAPQRALADPATNLNFTVSVDSRSVGSHELSAYKVFEAEIDDDNNSASSVQWAGSYGTALATFLDSADNGAAKTYSDWRADNDNLADTPANALAYIAEMIDGSQALGSPGGRAPAKSSFAQKLAAEVASVGTPVATGTASMGSAASFTGLGEGYYLFYNVNLPAMWTPVGGDTSTGIVKDPTYLTSSKAVKLDDGSWGSIADAGNGQTVTFRVTGDTPEAVPAESVQFVYNLEDALPAGLTADATSVKVYAVHGTTASPIETQLSAGYYTATETGGTLTVAMNDLYSTSGAESSVLRSTTDPVTSIVFEYEATLNANATLGTSYNENSAKIKYGAGAADIETAPSTAKVATYQLEVTKNDSSDSAKTLQGAEFTLQKDGQYVQADGTLGSAAHTFTTNASGVITVQHIDAGTYVLTETKPPANYSAPTVAATTIEITSVLDQTEGEIASLTAKATNSGDVETKVTVGDGKIALAIDNDPDTVLPITGMTPNQLGTVIGVLLVAAGVVALVVRARRKAQA